MLPTVSPAKPPYGSKDMKLKDEQRVKELGVKDDQREKELKDKDEQRTNDLKELAERKDDKKSREQRELTARKDGEKKKALNDLAKEKDEIFQTETGKRDKSIAILTEERSRCKDLLQLREKSYSTLLESKNDELDRLSKENHQLSEELKQYQSDTTAKDLRSQLTSLQQEHAQCSSSKDIVLAFRGLQGQVKTSLPQVKATLPPGPFSGRLVDRGCPKLPIQDKMTTTIALPKEFANRPTVLTGLSMFDLYADGTHLTVDAFRDDVTLGGFAIKRCSTREYQQLGTSWTATDTRAHGDLHIEMSSVAGYNFNADADVEQPVKFEKPYSKNPIVIVFIQAIRFPWKNDRDRYARFRAGVKDITPSGCTIVLHTWEKPGCTIDMARVGYIAYDADAHNDRIFSGYVGGRDDRSKNPQDVSFHSSSSSTEPSRLTRTSNIPATFCALSTFDFNVPKNGQVHFSVDMTNVTPTGARVAIANPSNNKYTETRGCWLAMAVEGSPCSRAQRLSNWRDPTSGDDVTLRKGAAIDAVN